MTKNHFFVMDSSKALSATGMKKAELVPIGNALRKEVAVALTKQAFD